MSKLPKSNGIKKIDLDDIILLDNVRKDYPPKEIEERARSIEREGQLMPVGLTKDYELIWGWCRYYAHKLLVAEGKPYTQIEYKIHTGDFDVLQIVENVQRSNLKPADLEAGLKKMVDKGMKPKEIADRLNKSLSWVCDSLKAGEIRESITVDTSEISSSAMSLLRGLSPEELEKVIAKVKKNGGTVKAVKEAIQKDPFDKIRKEALKLKKAGYDYQEIIEEIGEVLL